MKRALLLVTGLVTVLVVAVVVALATLDIERYRDQIVASLEEATGRDLEIAGGLEVGLSLVPTIVAGEIRFGNAPWGTRPEMLRVGRLEARIALLPLLAGDLRIRELVLESPQILLETDAAGHGNWVFGEPGAASEPSGGPAAFSLDAVRITDGRLDYRDGVTGETNAIAIASAVIAADGPSAPMRVAIEADVDGQPVTAEGTLGPYRQLVTDRDYAIDLAIGLGAARVSLKGTLARPLRVQGVDLALEASAPSLADLPWRDAAGPPGAGPLSLTARLADDATGYAITGLRVAGGGSSLSGRLDVATGVRTRVTGQLYSEHLDLATLLAPRDAESPAPDRVFSADPLPLGWLEAFDAEVALDARSIVTRDGLAFTNVTTTLLIEEGRLRLDPLDADVAGGHLLGRIELARVAQGVELVVDLRAEQVQPGELPDFRGDVTGAATDIVLEARGTGASVAEIMAGLDGRLLAEAGPGTLDAKGAAAVGSDLFLEIYRMLNPAAQRDQRVQIECAVLHFSVRDGIALTDRGVALATPQMNVVGSGLVNLANEGIDLGITTEAREGVGISAGQLADLVRLGGTLANPEPTLDPGGALMTGVSAGAAVATSGLSLLAQGLYDRLTADEAPCATALAMRDSRARTTGEKAADAVKGVGNAIKGAFQGLFGD